MSHLTLEQRYVIEAYLKIKKSKDFIADYLQVHRSTIYREIKRNTSKTVKYSAKLAHEYACERKDRFIVNRKFDENCRILVEKYLKEYWSPEQIVGWCKKHNITMVSTERIYQFIRQDKENGGQLYKYTRHKLKHRKQPISKGCSRIKDRISIEQRPEKVNNREEFGHFEMDLVIGKNHQGAILTLTERVTRFFMCRFLPDGKIATKVAEAVNDVLLPYKDYVHSITTDNGLEFAEHKLIAKKLDTKIYFTHPYSSWEKGQIENANKLLRQYIPKKQIIDKHNTQDLRKIQVKLNNRPRKNLNFEKPVKLFYNFINQKVAFAT